MRNSVKARLDISIQHPPVTMSAEQLYLGDRVVGPPVRPEPIGDRLKVGLEDGFQHQLQRGLNHPISDGRNS